MGNLFTNQTATVVGQGRVGAINHANDNSTALFLKKFAGEVLTVFDEKNIMKPLHTIRTITKGKSAQFPIIGTAQAGYYTPGSDILDPSDNAVTTGDGSASAGLNQFKQTEQLIHIDKVLMSSTFIASIDELVSHFDVRAPYTHQLGEALANQFDKNVLKVAVKTGAKNGDEGDTGTDAGGLLPSDAFISGQTRQGSVVYSAREHATNIGDKVNTASAADSSNANKGTEGMLRLNPDAGVIRTAFAESARLLDEKDVPASDRYAIITPAMYYALINSGDIVTGSVINKDIGGQGSIASGTITQLFGINILTSNHIPGTATGSSGNDTSTANQWSGSAAGGNSYALDYQDVAGVVFQKGGFGTLKLMDLTMESEYLIQRQGNLFVAKYSMGHGSLRPESVVVWSDGTMKAS